jgi:hypothetical protein
LSGHGRTGIISCCLIASLLFLSNSFVIDHLNKIKGVKKNTLSSEEIKKLIHALINDFDKTNNNSDIYKLRPVARNIFKLSQIYIMISLRLFRKTNLKQNLVPDNANQINAIYNVIYSYLIDYMTNGKFSFDISTADAKDKCEESTFTNNDDQKLWPCAKNVGDTHVTVQQTTSTVTTKSDLTKQQPL